MMKTLRFLFAAITAGILIPAHGAEVPVATSDPFARQSSWQVPDREHVWQQLQQWMDQASLDRRTRQAVQSAWEESSDQELLEAVAQCFSVADESLNEMLAFCRAPRQSPLLPSFPVLDTPLAQGWAGDQLSLIFGRWLASNGYLEEAQEQLSGLEPHQVVDPATLLFYQAVANYRLLAKDQCLATINALLENPGQVPQRYAAVARLMKADLEPLEPDSLDEVSRMMARIRLRLDLGRAGTRVREEEQSVIDKLDKMIKKLEEQAQQSQATAAAGAAGGNQPMAPAQGGLPAGPTGPGDIDPRDKGTATDWGNLPPKEREAALQQLGEDLPTHYRDVIEEYFRRLASESSEPAQP